MANNDKKRWGEQRQMIANFYFWKWAETDLPGKPTEVFAALMRGELHPALQPFDARPVLCELQKVLNQDSDPAQWEWHVVPEDRLCCAHYVFLTGPARLASQNLHDVLWKPVRPLVTCFDENEGKLDSGFPPKLNKFYCGQWTEAPAYDVTLDELPVLLRRIRPRLSDPFAVLSNRRTSFVQCYAYGRRFVVEWRENYDLSDLEKFDHWRAQDRKRLEASENPYDDWPDVPSNEDHPDLLTYSDTLRIFQAFLRDGPRPTQYHWMNINHWKDIG